MRISTPFAEVWPGSKVAFRPVHQAESPAELLGSLGPWLKCVFVQCTEHKNTRNVESPWKLMTKDFHVINSRLNHPLGYVKGKMSISYTFYHRTLGHSCTFALK